MYGEGISKMGELLDLGVQAGIIDKSGAWFSYGDERVGQGRENAKTFFKENPEMAAEIEQKIRANAGLIGDTMLGNPEEFKDDDAGSDGSSVAEPETASDAATNPVEGG
jgi:recombination protein RecA